MQQNTAKITLIFKNVQIIYLFLLTLNVLNKKYLMA